MSKEFDDPKATIAFVESLKRRWMATVDAMVDALMIIRPDYTISQANRAMAELSGRNVKEIVGKKCHEIFANSSTPCKGCKLMDTFTQQSAANFELEEIGDHRSYEVSSQVMRDESGKIDGVLNIYRDRTQAKQLQRQLMQNEKLASIGLLAGGVAHEINNPLGGILIFSQMLLREMDQKSQHYEDVKEIEAATQRCKSIVESLLEFAHQQPLASNEETHELIDLRESIQSALKFSSVGGATSHVEVEQVWDDKPYLVKGNRNKTIQVLLNLIQNAIHAMPHEGKLALRIKRQNLESQSYIVIEVEDTGIGIAESELEKIFDPFYTSKAQGEGTGLGLSICYGIAEDMGGWIDVESKINLGSCFKFIVPEATVSRKSA